MMFPTVQTRLPRSPRATGNADTEPGPAALGPSRPCLKDRSGDGLATVQNRTPHRPYSNRLSLNRERLVTMDILSQRLRNQKLVRSDIREPVEIVAWLGAVQAQDYAGAKWALNLRARVSTDLTEADVDRAFDEGSILRTHILRPTWHFVAPADIRWMLALTGPRVLAANRYYCRKNGLDDKSLARSRKAIERALGGGAHLTRAALGAVLARAGLDGRRPAAGLLDDGCGARAGDLQRTASGQAVHLRPPRRARASCPHAHARRGARRAHHALFREPRAGNGARLRVVVRADGEAGECRPPDARAGRRSETSSTASPTGPCPQPRREENARTVRIRRFTCFPTTTSS